MREAIVADLYHDGLARSVAGGGVELFSPSGKGNGTAVGEGSKGVRCDRIIVVVTKGLAVEDWIVDGEVLI